MPGSSPIRRGIQSLDISGVPVYLSDDRNNELNHQEALAAAFAEHERVREAAVRVIQLHEAQLEQQRLKREEEEVLKRQKLELERLDRERRIIVEQQRLQELEARKVEPPPPPPKPVPKASPRPEADGIAPPTKPETARASASSQQPASETTPDTSQITKPFTGTTPQASQATSQAANETTPVPSSISQIVGAGQKSAQHQTPPAPSPFAQAKSSGANPFATASTPKENPFGKATAPLAINGTSQTAAVIPSGPAAAIPTPGPAIVPDRYTHIHGNLKQLRANIKTQMNTNRDLKSRAGDMRREIRKCVGQLTGGVKGANRIQLDKIRRTLTESLTGQPQSVLVDPSDYICDSREPMEGAVHNGQMPSLFIFLLNHLAKAIINQYINECSSNPGSADPVGVLAAQMFSTKEFQWRGKTLIDILMAKFRVACPVLFGYNGSEKTQQGRQRLGWKKDDGGKWQTDQQHADRMKGLGVGYASIALRDFSRSNNVNPWPPAKYWKSFAGIVNTPATEISDTQCVVLRAMIYLYEEKFLNFYGNQAVAAMRKALVEFPEKANKTSGALTLRVLAQQYRKDFGLDLAA